MEQKYSISVPLFSLESIGFITWIVFMILGYGVHVDWLTPFWIWFPLWAPLALDFIVLLLLIFIGLIAGAIMIDND